MFVLCLCLWCVYVCVCFLYVFVCVCLIFCIFVYYDCVCVWYYLVVPPSAPFWLITRSTHRLTVDFRNFIVLFWAETLAHWNPTSCQKTSTIGLFGFETLKLKIRRLKLWKPTVCLFCIMIVLLLFFVWLLWLTESSIPGCPVFALIGGPNPHQSLWSGLTPNPLSHDARTRTRDLSLGRRSPDDWAIAAVYFCILWLCYVWFTFNLLLAIISVQLLVDFAPRQLVSARHRSAWRPGSPPPGQPG